MVSFVGKLSVVVVLLEGKMAAAFKFTMIAAVVVALGEESGFWERRREMALLCSGQRKETWPASCQSTSCMGYVDMSITLKRYCLSQCRDFESNRD